MKISTLVENPDLQKGWGGCGEGHPRGGDQAGKDLCRLHGGQPGQHPKIGHVIKCDDQELATMINKGKGKLKWERDMPLVVVLGQTEVFQVFVKDPDGSFAGEIPGSDREDDRRRQDPVGLLRHPGRSGEASVENHSFI